MRKIFPITVLVILLLISVSDKRGKYNNDN